MRFPVRLRSAAEQDVTTHAEYIQRDSLEAALRFLDAVDEALELIGNMPEIGALCHFQNLHYAGMRVRAIPGFRNHLVFYRILHDEIEVIRVLHGARDLPTVFGEEVNS